MDELRSFAYHGMLLYGFTCLYSTLFYQLFNSVLLVLPQPYWLMRFYFLPIYLSIGTVINQNVGFIFFIRGCTSHKSIRYGTFLSPIVKRFSVANVINLVNMTLTFASLSYRIFLIIMSHPTRYLFLFGQRICATFQC